MSEASLVKTKMSYESRYNGILIKKEPLRIERERDRNRGREKQRQTGRPTEGEVREGGVNLRQ